MTNPMRIYGVAVIVAMSLVTGACAKKTADDYCRDHYLYHAEHIAKTGTLNVLVGDDGQLTSALLQPAVIFSADDSRRAGFVSALNNVDAVYTAGSQGQCSHDGTTVTEDAGVIRAEYNATCNTDAILKKVDVTIFDLADEIDEMVVTVVTPATSKRFAISRQCDAAIFRIDTQ